MVRESALRLAVRLLMADDRFDPKNCQAILQKHPELIGKLLDLALLPRSSSVPHCELDVLAIFALSRLVAAPGAHSCALWMDRQLTRASKVVREEDWVAFYDGLICDFPKALDRLVGAYRKGITEFSEGYDHLMSRVC